MPYVLDLFIVTQRKERSRAAWAGRCVRMIVVSHSNSGSGCDSGSGSSSSGRSKVIGMGEYLTTQGQCA